MGNQWNSDSIPAQSGRVALVTGGNSGLGFHTSRGLAAKGAHVLLASRSIQRGAQAAEAIRRQLPQAKLTVVELDLADLASVQRCAETVHDGWERLDILVNNAGVLAFTRQETAQGFEQQFGVNHLGHFALTGQLLPLLLRTADSRVVSVSSLAHRSGRLNFNDLQGERSFSSSGAYAQSKMANLLFAFELQRRLSRIDATTRSVAAHPGLSATNIVRSGAKGGWSTAAVLISRVLAQSAEQGALPQLFAATAPAVNGGDYIGPDGWLGMRGYPQKTRAQASAYDEKIARQLWQTSVALTGEAYRLFEE